MTNERYIEPYLLPQRKTPKRDTEITRKKLYYDYLYIQNYDEEDEETKRDIREYFDRELHYKGSFYRYRNKFNKRGSPLGWSDKEVERYRHLRKFRKYESGLKVYKKEKTFFPQTEGYKELFLLRLEKKTKIELVKRTSKNEIIINYKALDYIEKLTNKMINFMLSLDNSKGKVRVQEGYIGKVRDFNLNDLRIVVFIDCKDFIRCLSTGYHSPTLTASNIRNVIEDYLESLLDNTRRKYMNSEIYPDEGNDEFIVQEATLTSIEVNKRSNKPYAVSNEQRRRINEYMFYIRKMRSFISRVS